MLATPGRKVYPTTPCHLYFSAKPSIGRFRVFGHPCIDKVYRRVKTDTGRQLDSKNIVQRGVRGIFVDFLRIRLAGLSFALLQGLFWSAPMSVSMRRFSLPWHTITLLSMMPPPPPPRTQPNDQYPDLQALARTGVHPMTFLTPAEDANLGKWCPQHLYHPTDPPLPFRIAHKLTDSIFEPEHLKEGNVDDDDEDDDDSDNLSSRIEMVEMRSPKASQAYSIVNSIAIEMSLPLDIQGAYATLCHIIANAEITPGSPGTDPAPFLPEPSTVRAVLRLPLAMQRAWFAALAKEISGLVFKRKVFAKETLFPGEQVVPLTEVFKAKLDKDGLIDKLKARVCFRGDLYRPTSQMDPYSPHASSLPCVPTITFILSKWIL